MADPIQGFKPEEYLRSDTAVLWGAKTDEAELLGEWIAPAAGQPGRLELCSHSLMEVVTPRVPGQMIVWLLAGVGALGSSTTF